jgi:deazaflavin-dependent oxidoreductase (nitroreductase family)
VSFDTRKGTRGTRQPNGRFFRWVNTFMARRLRRSANGKTMGFNALVLHTVGRRTGAERVNPVGWWPGPAGSWLICASANAAMDNPAWYYNLAAHPDQVSIEVNGETIPVTGGQLHGAERDAAWRQIATATPRFAQYQAKTDRELPIIRLTRRAADPMKV